MQTVQGCTKTALGYFAGRMSLLSRSSAPPERPATFEATVALAPLSGCTDAVFRRLARRFLGPEVRHVEAFPTGTIPLAK